MEGLRRGSGGVVGLCSDVIGMCGWGSRREISDGMLRERGRERRREKV